MSRARNIWPWRRPFEEKAASLPAMAIGIGMAVHQCGDRGIMHLFILMARLGLLTEALHA